MGAAKGAGVGSGSTDRIEKSVDLRAPVSRVWRALTDHREFGEWFRADLDSAFEVGKTVRGRITYPGYEHLEFEAEVVSMERERLFAFRWPNTNIEEVLSAKKRGDSLEWATTLVEFRLEPRDDGGTRLTVIESGFDRLPAAWRETAFRLNDGGWAEQMGHIAKHVDEAS